MAARSVLSDPMLRMLALAIVAAGFFPVSGAWREIATNVANAAIFVLFLANGLRTARREVARGLLNWRFLLPLAAWVFGAMALAGLFLFYFASNYLPALVALGFLYLGVLPSTVQSATSYTSLAAGNVALAVVSAALLNILGMFVSAPLFFALGGSGEGEIGMQSVAKILAILVLPFVIGLAVQTRVAPLVDRHRHQILWLDRIVIATAVYIAFSGAVEQGIWRTVEPLAWLAMLGLIVAMLLFGHGGAWLFGGILGINRKDRICFLFSGAQKSAAVGAPLATILFPPSQAGFVVLPLLLYHFLQLVIAAPLSVRLASRSGEDGADCSGPTTTARAR